MADRYRLLFIKLTTYAIRLYRALISPMLQTCCIYHPSCSHYAESAISKYGAFRGARMAILRVLRCHPFHCGGFDPVP